MRPQPTRQKKRILTLTPTEGLPCPGNLSHAGLHSYTSDPLAGAWGQRTGCVGMEAVTSQAAAGVADGVGLLTARGDIPEPSILDGTPWLSISNHSAWEGIMNILPLLFLSVPQTLKPSNLSAKNKHKRTKHIEPRYPHCRKHFKCWRWGAGGQDTGQRTNKTETTMRPSANPPRPSSFVCFGAPVYARYFVGNDPSKILWFKEHQFPFHS